MKRTRDDLSASESAHAVQFEIMHGLTRERCEGYTAMVSAGHARMLSTNPQNVNGVDLAVLFNNMALPWMPGAELVTSALWLDNKTAGASSHSGGAAANANTAEPHDASNDEAAEAGSSPLPPDGEAATPIYSDDLSSVPGPAFIRTVQLVASDGEMLIFANGSGSSGTADGTAQSLGPALSVRVAKHVGEQIFPGDVVLVTQAPLTQAGGEATASSVRLCTLDATAFDNAEAWQDAVSTNVVAALKWLSALCGQAPGLPQLTFMEASRAGDLNHTGNQGGNVPVDGWTRLLQLPLLLQVSRSLRPSLNRSVVEKLERSILSLLATMLSVFKHSQTVMSLPEIHRGLLHSFLASPLFVDGLSDILIRSADVLGSTPWQGVSESLAVGVELALTFACEPLSERDAVSGSVCTRTQEAAKSALGGFETVLHRLSGVWTEYTRKLQEMRRHGQQHVPDSLYKEQRIADMLEALAAEHTFRPVTRWLQQREVLGQEANLAGASGGGGGADVSSSTLTPLDRIQQPPTLSHIEALVESVTKRMKQDDHAAKAAGGVGGSILRSGVVEEQLLVMHRTYTPYLTKDVVRFVEAAAVAGHSELYGPAARAVCRVLQTFERGQPNEEVPRNEDEPRDEEAEAEVQRARDRVREEAAAEVASQRMRVLAVEQHGLRAGGFGAYSFAELRHMAEYGLPVRLPLRLPKETSEDDGVVMGEGDDSGDEEEREAAARAAAAASAAATAAAIAALKARVARRHGGSCFAFLVVRFLGRAAVFPLIVTGVESAVASSGGHGTDAVACAYVMREADVLAEFVQTSGAIEESGLPDAWLLCGDDPCDLAVPEESLYYYSGRGGPHQHHSNSNNPFRGGAGGRHGGGSAGYRGGGGGHAYGGGGGRGGGRGRGGRGGRGSGRGGQRGGGRGSAGTSRGAVNEALSQELKPRFLPLGTPALTYIDLLTRLNKTRVELKEELNTGVEKGSYGRATLAASLGADASSLGLWMRYFAKGTAPLQTNVHGLSTNATGIVTGTGTLGKELSSRLLREATDAAASLTPAQVEALDTLSSGTLAQASSGSSGAFHATQYLANLRIVEGSVGSGKTSMLYAAGALKGKVLATARKEHQASVGAKLKDATARVRKCQTSIVSATSLAEIVPDEKSTTTTPETMSAAVEGQLSAFSRLSRGVHYCSTPLLIRCGRLGASETRTGRMPDATRALLYRDRRDLASGAASTETSTGMPTLGSLTELLDASLARSCKAPLALQLARLLDDLRAHAARLSALATAESDGSDAAAHKYLDAGLLPLIMSTREIQETFARASAADAAQHVTWASYLSTQLWATATVRPVQDNDEEDEEDEMEEKPTCPPIVTFPSVVDNSETAAHDLLWAPQLRLPGGRPEVVPVQMPANIHLARLSMDEAAAWHAVFLKNQREAVPLLLHQLHSLIRRVFRLFLDLVLGVAATAQVGHFDLIASSDWELLQSYGLPFLWRWAPSHVLVDDFAGLQDGLLLALTPANSLTVSLSTEVPIYVERRLHRGPLSILRALRKDLQRTAALATTSLNESLRCPKAEVTASLGQMCLASGNVPFAGLLQPTMDKEEDDDEDGRRESEDAAKEKPCFPGFSSFSSLELWTHAVPVRAATTADEEAAAFICRSIRKHTRDTAGRAGSAKRLQVCFPFPQEARQFTEHHLLPNHHEAAREERRAWRSRPPHPESLTTPSVLCTVSAVSFPFTGTHPGSVTRESFLPSDYDPEDSEGALVSQRNTTATGVAGEAAAVGEETDGYECDIAILCLSSLVPFQPNLHGSGGDKNGGGGHGTANEGRAALWKGLLALTAPKDGDAAFAAAAGGAAPTGGAPVTAASARGPSAFMERLQWWLWCTVSRAREGVIVVCSKEFALHVPMFQYVEKYVVQLRRQLCPARVLRYWLPRSTVCAVLAFNCPDHFRCRHTAAVVQSDEHRSGYGSRSACEVVVRGAELCESLCLQAYAHCTTRSHACLHPCHVEVSTAEAAGGRDDTHDHCPYPCGRTLSCGHPCNKDCGSVCDPCTFVGLTELPCGQRVVCGTNSADKSIQYELVRHFQESKCGAPLLPCTLLVTARCPRCGTKSKVPCFQLTAHESRERQALKDAQRHEKRQQARAANGGNNSSSSARAAEEEEEAQDGTGAEAAALANIPFLLSDGECPGCVAVYNRVAAKFGFDAVPEPTVVQRLCDEPPSSTPTGEGAEEGDENLCAMRERATLPRHQLSAEAQAELRKAFAVAAKRAELLLMKEALEVSNGSAADTSDYVTAKREYDTLKATQQRQIQERQDDIRGQVVAWAHRLRNEFTKQSELTANLEAMMPSLLSEAQDEAARQRRYGF